jgi:hypothetical protein
MTLERKGPISQSLYPVHRYTDRDTQTHRHTDTHTHTHTHTHTPGEGEEEREGQREREREEFFLFYLQIILHKQRPKADTDWIVPQLLTKENFAF